MMTITRPTQPHPRRILQDQYGYVYADNYQRVPRDRWPVSQPMARRAAGRGPADRAAELTPSQRHEARNQVRRPAQRTPASPAQPALPVRRPIRSVSDAVAYLSLVVWPWVRAMLFGAPR